MLPAAAGCCGDEACALSLLGRVPSAFQTPSFSVGHSGHQAAAGPAPSLEQPGGARSGLMAWFTLERKDG